MYKIDRVYTENPYVDELVYYTKLLGFGTVLKNEQEAHMCETLESLKAAELYISCIEGTAIFELFSSYSRSSMEAAGLSEETIKAALKDPEAIPMNKRDIVLKNQSKEYVDGYEEKNNYYRMLFGLPNFGAQPVYVTDWIPPDGVVIDLTIPVHLMDLASINLLITYGVIDDLLSVDYMNRRYLKYIGTNKIKPYIARKASRFDPLYIPPIDNDAITKMYKDKLEVSRLYTLRTVYSDAFAYGSDYYDSFIGVFIVLTTMLDLLSRVQEFIARKEIFDIRSIQYIFKSYGIPYFEEIPLKYQINMVKNIHTLLKYKSTSKCMIDICSLFGFNNVSIFKYYLLKDRNVDLKTGDYTFFTKEVTNDDGTVSIIEDNEANFDLKFIKIPLQEEVDGYIRNPSNHIDYDDITVGDPTWDGSTSHEEIKKQILDKEFNYARTKYISIDSVYDITKISLQQSYFFNMLYDDVKLEELVKVSIPYINPQAQIRVSDIFTFLTVLTYSFHEIKDLIIDSGSKILYVNGFNFKADLGALAGDLKNRNYELRGIEALSGFKIPDSPILDFHELMNLFINNLDARKVLVDGMYKADNARIYKVYKKLYDALMTMELTFDYYKDPATKDFYRDEHGDATYTEFIKHRDTSLYYAILQIETMEDNDTKTQYIATMIDNIIYALEEYIDTDKFSGIFSNLPIMSTESIKQYIATVINFFKSYKVDFLGLNTIYYLDDKYDGIIKLIDDCELHRFWEKNEIVKLYDIIQNKSSIAKSEQIHLVEKLYLDVFTWKYHTFNERIALSDSVTGRNVTFFKDDVLGILDRIGMLVTKTANENITLSDSIATKSNLSISDSTGIYDRVWIVPEGETPTPPPATYMDMLDPSTAGEIVIASPTGNAAASGVRMPGPVVGTSPTVLISEKGVVDSFNSDASKISTAQVVKEIADAEHVKPPSDGMVVSEKAFLQSITFKEDKKKP